MKKAFNQHRENGIALTFQNGNWISSVWGPMTYCDNYRLEREPGEDISKFYQGFRDSDTVEIMVKAPEEALEKIREIMNDEKEQSDGLWGYVTLGEWLKILQALK